MSAAGARSQARLGLRLPLAPLADGLAQLLNSAPPTQTCPSSTGYSTSPAAGPSAWRRAAPWRGRPVYPWFRHGRRWRKNSSRGWRPLRHRQASCWPRHVEPPPPRIRAIKPILLRPAAGGHSSRRWSSRFHWMRRFWTLLAAWACWGPGVERGGYVSILSVDASKILVGGQERTSRGRE